MTGFSTLDILSLIFTVFSSLGLVFVILSISVSGLFKTLNYRIFLYTCLSLLILSISLILPVRKYPGICEFQGFVNNFGSLSCIIWSSVAFYNVFSEIICDKAQSEIYYLSLGFIIPLLITLPEFILGAFGDNNAWCSFDSNAINEYVLILQIFVPIFVSIFLNVTLIMRIRYFFTQFPIGYKTEEFLNKKNKYNQMKKLPICINICFLMPMIYEYYYLRGNASNIIINCIGIIGETLVGYCASVCFATNFLFPSKNIHVSESDSSSYSCINESIMEK